MGGYWIDSPDNPFNQMNYTRGGGGYDNSGTHESNARRADAMQGAGAAALPHFANVGVANAYYPGKGLAVVDGNVIRTTGPGSASARTEGGGGGSGGAGAGASRVATGPRGGGTGAGSRLVISGPLKPVLNDEITQFQVGGITMHPDRYTSNVQDIEDRWGDAEFLSPAWFASWGVAGVDVITNINRYRDEVGQSMISTLDTWARSQPKLAEQIKVPMDEAGWAPTW